MHATDPRGTLEGRLGARVILIGHARYGSGYLGRQLQARVHARFRDSRHGRGPTGKKRYAARMPSLAAATSLGSFSFSSYQWRS